MSEALIEGGVTFVVLNTAFFAVGLLLLGLLVGTFVHRWPRSTAALSRDD